MNVTRTDRPAGAVTEDSNVYRTVTTDGGREVAYGEYGATDGTPVALFHGAPGSRLLARLYDEAARDQGVRIVSIDRPGYGQSDPWPERTPSSVGEYVEPVLNHAGAGSVGVVGFSGGGVDALALAETRPELVGSVDLVSGAVPPHLGETPRVLRVLSKLASTTPWLLRRLYGVQARVAERLSPSFVLGQYTTDDCQDDVPEDVAGLIREDFLEAVGHSRSGVVTESRLFTDDWGVSLGRIDPEVRLWHGTMDTNVPIEGARRLADALPNGTLREFEGCDHVTTLLRSRADLLESQSSEIPQIRLET